MTFKGIRWDDIIRQYYWLPLGLFPSLVNNHGRGFFWHTPPFFWGYDLWKYLDHSLRQAWDSKNLARPWKAPIQDYLPMPCSPDQRLFPLHSTDKFLRLREFTNKIAYCNSLIKWIENGQILIGQFWLFLAKKCPKKPPKLKKDQNWKFFTPLRLRDWKIQILRRKTAKCKQTMQIIPAGSRHRVYSVLFDKWHCQRMINSNIDGKNDSQRTRNSTQKHNKGQDKHKSVKSKHYWTSSRCCQQSDHRYD